VPVLEDVNRSFVAFAMKIASCTLTFEGASLKLESTQTALDLPFAVVRLAPV
jgi:hypothetical protein